MEMPSNLQSMYTHVALRFVLFKVIINKVSGLLPYLDSSEKWDVHIRFWMVR